MTSESDETIQIYNVKEGRHEKALVSKKYGAKLARFTHWSNNIVYASTKQNRMCTHSGGVSLVVNTPMQMQSDILPPTTTPSCATSRVTKGRLHQFLCTPDPTISFRAARMTQFGCGISKARITRDCCTCGSPSSRHGTPPVNYSRLGHLVPALSSFMTTRITTKLQCRCLTSLIHACLLIRTI